MGSFADRLLDTLGLGFIALVSAWIAWKPRLNSELWLGWPLIGLGVLVAVGFAVALSLDRLINLDEPSGKLMRLLAKLARSAAELLRNPSHLFLCLVLSMAIQCLFVGINIAFARAAHIEAPVAAWFYAWTAAKIIAIAPVSLGGLGVREASMAGLIKPFGADPAQVIAIGLVWQSVLYASGLIGFCIQLRRPPPATSTAERL